MNPTIRNVILSGAQKTREQLVKSAGGVLYLDARKATGGGIPTNSPLTSPWKDLSSKSNNATPENFAGTTDSGYNENVAKPAWTLDGTDDYFSLINTASIDITTAPLAVFATLKMAVGAGTGYVFCKNLNSAGNVQYGIFHEAPSRRFITYLNGLPVGNTGVTTANTWINVGFVWNGTNLKYYVNNIQSGNTEAYNTPLTTRPNVNIGRRFSTVYLNGELATTTVYSGSKCTTANVLKAEKEISKQYI